MLSKKSIKRSLLLLIPLLFLLSLYALLLRGITLDSFDFSGFQIEKLYLKLDNKLILKVEKVRIPRSKEASDFQKIMETGPRRLRLLLHFFHSIELKDVEYTNDHYTLLYADKILYLQGRRYEIAGRISQVSEGLRVDVPLFYLRKYDLTLHGKLFYHYKSRRVSVEGLYKVPDLHGRFHLHAKGKRVNFWLDSEEASSLKRFSSMLPVESVIKEWIGERIQAKKYRLKYLRGEGIFDQKGAFHPLLASLQGVLFLYQAEIQFAKGLKKISADHVRALLKEKGLYFTLEKPRYGKKAIDGSSVALIHLDRAKEITLLLRLRYQVRLDQDLIQILKHYALPIEIRQKSGKVRAKIALDLPLESGRRSKIEGTILFSAGIVEFHGRRWRIGGGKVAFTHDDVRFEDLKILEPFFHGSCTGRVNFPLRNAKILCRIDRLMLGGKSAFFRISKKKIKIQVHWNSSYLVVRVPFLGVEAKFGKRGDLSVRFMDLKRLRPWLVRGGKLLQGGTLTIKRSQGGRWSFSGEVKMGISPFYTRKEELMTFPFRGKYDGKKLSFVALDSKIRYDGENKTLFLSEINIDGKKLLEFFSLLGRERADAKGSSLHVLGKKSLIRYGRYVLITDRYRLDKNGANLTFAGLLGSDRIVLEKSGSKIEISAQEIGDRMLHSLIHFNALQGGRYSFHLEGTIGKEYRGEILIRGGVLKDLKAYNDMIALFNTVPALMTFSSPGFSEKGFELRRGKILFRLQGKILRLDSIELLGKSSTVAGKGTVDLESGNLKIDLGVQTAREVGKTLGKIPLLGYILFGKDKSLTAGVKIRGTFKKPKVSTNPVGEALLYPLELLKRTLLSPSELLHPTKQKTIPASPPSLKKETPLD